MLNLVEESVKSAIADILDDPFVVVPFRLTLLVVIEATQHIIVLNALN